jgi:tetratricopeptide (TPR) repeat protein
MVTRILPQAIVGVVIAGVIVILAFVQVASDALYASAAAPGTFPHYVPFSFGLHVYRLLDRIAPSPYVDSTLASIALQRGDLDAAEHYAVAMPNSSVRNDLLGRVALARGQNALATEYFFVAPDPAAMNVQIRKLTVHDIPGALDLEQRFRDRLIELGTHPDLVAESYWHSAVMAAALRRNGEAMASYEAAVRLAPLNMNYVLSAADQALLDGDTRTAERYYRIGRRADPGSAEFVAGLGLVALREGQRALAVQYLHQAMGMNPNLPLVMKLSHELRGS